MVDLWNRLATPPFSRVREPLSPDRLGALVRACKAVPQLDDWHALIVWMNGQKWMRASGTGAHPTWVASLDWLVKRPGNVQAYVDRARGHRASVPTTTAGIRAATRESGVAATGAEDFDLVGPETSCIR